MSLYVSSRTVSDGVVVGSNVHASTWRAVLYDKISTDLAIRRGDEALANQSYGGLRAGSCVRLFHLESSSWLEINSGGRHKGADTTSTNQVTLQFSDEKDIDRDAKHALSSDSIWEITRTTTFEGGEVKWSDVVAFRHLLSGKYLAVSSHMPSPVRRGRSPVTMPAFTHTCTHAVAEDFPQAFCLMPTAVTEEEYVEPNFQA